jgi:hypothetical protein
MTFLLILVKIGKEWFLNPMNFIVYFIVTKFKFEFGFELDTSLGKVVNLLVNTIKNMKGMVSESNEFYSLFHSYQVEI